MSKAQTPVEIRAFRHAERDWDRAVQLRLKVLREPLGISFDPEDLARENVDYHLGAFAGERVLGCLIMTKLTDRSVKMRQVAVDFETQGQGIGRQLVARSEEWAREQGFDEIVLNAREVAIPFYTALGYLAVGEGFVEVGIPHRKMLKVL